VATVPRFVAADPSVGNFLRGDIYGNNSLQSGFSSDCGVYGPGFSFSPGLNSCLKSEGYLRYQPTLSIGGMEHFIRLNLAGKSRSYTEHGILHGYGAFNLDMTFDAERSSNKGYVHKWVMIPYIEQAYMHLAGFTLGRAKTPWHFLSGDILYFKYGRENCDSYVDLVSYTHGFGNGVTAAVSIENPSALSYDSERYYNKVRRFPDLAGNIRVSQGWGSSQVMIALRDGYGKPSSRGGERTDHNSLGWAVGFGTEFSRKEHGSLGFRVAYGAGALKRVSTFFPSSRVSDFTHSGLKNKAVALHVAGKQLITDKLSLALSASYARYFKAQTSDTSTDTSTNDKYLSQKGVGIALHCEPVPTFSVSMGAEYMLLRDDLRDEANGMSRSRSSSIVMGIRLTHSW